MTMKDGQANAVPEVDGLKVEVGSSIERQDRSVGNDGNVARGFRAENGLDCRGKAVSCFVCRFFTEDAFARRCEEALHGGLEVLRREAPGDEWATVFLQTFAGAPLDAELRGDDLSSLLSAAHRACCDDARVEATKRLGKRDAEVAAFLTEGPVGVGLRCCARDRGVPDEDEMRHLRRR